jgi:hypothetical protein
MTLYAAIADPDVSSAVVITLGCFVILFVLMDIFADVWFPRDRRIEEV